VTSQPYAVGETVSIAHRSLSGPITNDYFTVVHRYVIERGAPLYHVRSLIDGDERMVPESELASAGPDIFKRKDDRPGNILWLFPKVMPFDRGLPR
jgi:hypothetical protein